MIYYSSIEDYTILIDTYRSIIVVGTVLIFNYLHTDTDTSGHSLELHIVDNQLGLDSYQLL